MDISSIFKSVLRPWVIGSAFVVGVPIELMLVGLVCNLLPMQAAITLLLISPFAIGVANYALYQRIGRETGIRSEAERWLAWRSRTTVQQRARLHRLKQTFVWAPSVIVTALFLFFPESFGVITHLWHGKAAKLVGYEVELPATWITDEPYINEFRTWASVGGYECKGPMRSGISRYLHATPIASAMYFTTPSSVNSEREKSLRRSLLSQDTFHLKDGLIVCRRYIPRYIEWNANKNLREIECSTATGDLSASFFGDESSIPTFYRTLRLVRTVP